MVIPVFSNNINTTITTYLITVIVLILIITSTLKNRKSNNSQYGSTLSIGVTKWSEKDAVMYVY
jgi:hypothetical protein